MIEYDLITRPDWTDVAWPPAVPVASLKDARDWLGIFGDTSVDDEVRACLEAAIEKVSSNVGYRVSDTRVTDYFSGAELVDTLRFELSEPGIDTSTIVVKYYEESIGALNIVDAADYFLDESSLASMVVIKEAKKPADISTTLSSPWVIAYSTKLNNVRGSPSLDRLKMGVRIALNWYWQSRGELTESSLLDRALYSTLRSCRKE